MKRSAQTALQVGLTLGWRVSESSAQGGTVIPDLVGLAIEHKMLEGMDPSSPFDTAGHTVQDRLDQIAQQRAAITELAAGSGDWLQGLSEPELWTASLSVCRSQVRWRRCVGEEQARQTDKRVRGKARRSE